jgi:hypothetical protein
MRAGIVAMCLLLACPGVAAAAERWVPVGPGRAVHDTETVASG